MLFQQGWLVINMYYLLQLGKPKHFFHRGNFIVILENNYWVLPMLIIFFYFNVPGLLC